jgi:NAD-dependent DNA ligase
MGEDEEKEAFRRRVGADRLASRQIDELIGIARGLVADNVINETEVEFLGNWLSSNQHINDQPLIKVLFHRVQEMLRDGIVDDDEKSELLDTLNQFSNRDTGLGEILKSTTLPLDNPEPMLTFPGKRFCFTGTFQFGQRKECEAAVEGLGASFGALTQKTNVLVIGIYATDSWKHSSFGNKILRACEWRDAGLPICIVSETHWKNFLRVPQ